MDWIEQTNSFFKFWADAQQSALQAMAPGMMKTGAGAAPGEAVNQADSLQLVGELWKSSMEKWVGLIQNQWAGKSISEDALRQLFDPSQWVKMGQGAFDQGIEHLIDGPGYATLWDIDRKMLKSQQLRLERDKDIAAYYSILQGAWSTAIGRFAHALNEAQGAPITSWRALTDKWIEIANDTLTEVHRSPAFLEAQRRVTRSATDYRLQEREIVEAFCEAHHIPTRTEVDEVQRTVYELRRDLRALRSGNVTGAAVDVPPPKKRTAKRLPPVKQRKRR